MQAGKHIRRDFFYFDIGAGPADANGYYPYCYGICDGGEFEVSYTIDKYLNASFFDGIPWADIMHLIKNGWLDNLNQWDYNTQ